MLEVQVRHMQEHDVDQIMEIEKVSFGSHHWSAQSFIAEMKNKLGNYFVAVDATSNKVVGYCGYWMIQEEAHITTVASSPALRKCGIGELLLQRMIESVYALEGKWLTLEVRASNIMAISLYKKYGFSSLGVRKNYYQDNNEDALIMWTESVWAPKFKENYESLKKILNDRNVIKVIG